MVKTLDAIALASFDTPTRVQRIAAIWARAFNNRYPESRAEIYMWVEHEFGPVLESEHHTQLAKLLLDETRRQIKLRRRRKKLREGEDPLTTPVGSPMRMGRLLQGRLGPARSHVSERRILQSYATDCCYIDAAVFSGLVAGLIPVAMRTRRFLNPCLLVYRQGKQPTMTRFVPGHITTVADAFIWLIPPDAAEFLRLPDTRVEHNGEAQEVRLITQFGTKVLPWRELSPH